MRLKDKVAIITGGSRGIGFAGVRNSIQSAELAAGPSKCQTVQTALRHSLTAGNTAAPQLPGLLQSGHGGIQSL